MNIKLVNRPFLILHLSLWHCLYWQQRQVLNCSFPDLCSLNSMPQKHPIVHLTLCGLIKK